MIEDNIAYEYMMNGCSEEDALRMADEYRTQQAEPATLRAENARLRDALMPFAILADVKFCGEWRDDESVIYTDIAHKFTFGLIRAAREALK